MNKIIKRFIMLFAVALFVFTAGVSAAQAASPHFKKNGSPVCTVTISGSTATTTCKAVITGLGGDDLLATVTVSGSAVYQCQNAGGNTAPGQNKVVIGPAVTATPVNSDAIKNGNLTLVTNPTVLSAPSTVSGSAAGCPNPNWTGVNPVVTVTSISLVIEQPPGTVIFTCSKSDPNGLTGSVALTC
ncbi:hypothetical protein [Arthrobacter sp. ISL-69]|uniref:hypothetical protein n=1 Tax=Arthrobacter sp. ISL-69 TaxID=2819113 RepID=UPI001BEA16AE|nr:hypothetical protein [Arthrobacter sp. ISL-69]MBT2538245.1 hypothetical protein [Arthrobacter sp. ISL-69]